MATNKGFGLFFEMGCGKTLTAIAIAGAGYRMGKVNRVLIVAPTSVVAVWPKELADYAAFLYTVKTLLGTKQQRLKDPEDLERFPYQHLKVAVINYESTWRDGIFEALMKYDADLIISDESQRIKTHDASQSKAMHKLGDQARYKMILSGTPVQNSAVDIWSQYRFLDRSIFGTNFYPFRAHYCEMGGFNGKQVIGVRKEAQNELITKEHSVAFRVTKAEALDLPEQTFENRLVAFSKKERDLYDQLRKDSYNGANATEQIAGYISAFEYKDVASGASDSIKASVNDPERKWIGPWFPEKGDKLVPTIMLHNWTAEGQTVQFPCGTFGVDDFSFSGGPIKMNLEAIALPASSSFKTEERTETYEKATLQEIGQMIAGRAGVSLFFEASDVNIEKVEQNNQNDCNFYSGLVEKYGLSLKIYNDRLVVFSEADYEAKGPKFVLTEADFDPGWTWNTTLTGIYTGVRYQYTNSDKNKTFTVKAGTEERLLTCNEPSDNLTEATAIALAAVNNANKGTTTMSITTMARPGLIASDTIEIAGLERLSGKYYVEEVTHAIGSGYKMSLNLRKVEPRISSPTAISSTVSEGG